ncbi:stage II sporulation protein D [Pelosinus sp. sgz500959]|uniref:stage II sporulation protein D n=1 Tax=Pelosinus sp. sgz500959 TaxID=3242472 RepID=UPI003670E66D
MNKVLAYNVLLIVVIVILIPALIIGSMKKIHFNPQQSHQTGKGEDVSIRVYMHEKGTILEMNLETYVAGVVAAEMPGEFELEALKSQAVAARTYAVKNMVLFGGSGLADKPGADVSTDYQQSQAWLSSEKLKERWGTEYERYWSKINRAVEETRGEVVTYNGEFINAVFHSTSGERTASAKEVWGFDYPYLISVPCSWDEKSPRYRERKEFALTEIEQLLGAETQVMAAMQNGSGVTQIIDTTPSGRVGQIRIGNKIVSGLTVREKLNLHSTRFNVAIKDGKMIFDTVGYGHGVGLCQYGANGMAKAGHDYRQIITTYYTGVAIKNIQSDLGLLGYHH